MGDRGTVTIPEVGVEFELTLDGDATDPIGMVHDHPEKWKFEGNSNNPKGVLTRRFKLVHVGYQPNLDAVRTALARHGEVPEGQWREAFKAAYPTPDGKGPIGFADPSWVGPGCRRFFPCLVEGGGRLLSDFYWAGSDRLSDWRWLLQVAGARKL